MARAGVLWSSETVPDDAWRGKMVSVACSRCRSQAVAFVSHLGADCKVWFCIGVLGNFDIVHNYHVCRLQHHSTVNDESASRKVLH